MEKPYMHELLMILAGPHSGHAMLLVSV